MRGALDTPAATTDGAAAAAFLLRNGSSHELPDRAVEIVTRLAAVPAAIYIVDIDGSTLHLLAGAPDVFPQAVVAPYGVGPEIPLELVEAASGAVSNAVPGSVCTPLILGDRALGFIVCRSAPALPLDQLASEVAIALELGSGYTDAVHAARRRRHPHPAAEVQQSLLPPRVARVTGARVAGGVLPGYEIGGDFFDYADNADGLWVTVADAVGKGNEAAALASLAVSALRSTRRSGGTLSDATLAMHDTISSIAPGVPFITAVTAVWDTDSGLLRWITAGHPRPLVVARDGTITTLSDGVTRPLGVPGHGAERSAAECFMPPGSRLVLYSDGIVEQPVEDGGRQFGIDRLLDAIQGGAGTPAAIVRRVQDAVVAASGGRLRDDATILVVARD